jgi:hypothetical protein
MLSSPRLARSILEDGYAVGRPKSQMPAASRTSAALVPSTLAADAGTDLRAPSATAPSPLAPQRAAVGNKAAQQATTFLVPETL